MGYEVQTPVFEGPFDLLLHLILRDEVDLWEISLLEIVDAYLAYVERLEGVDLETATEFLLIAATLVDLKARRLLPGREEDDLDEELARFEARDLLLARLLECKTFQDAARELHVRMAAAARAFPRLAGPEEPFRSLAPDPLERAGTAALLAAAIRGLAPKAPAEVRTDHVAPIRASVRDAVETVLALLPVSGSVAFRDLTAGTRERLEVVVRFLAVLELYKQGMVELDQADSFAELRVRPLEPGERVAIDLSALDDWEDAAPDVPAAGEAPGTGNARDGRDAGDVHGAREVHLVRDEHDASADHDAYDERDERDDRDEHDDRGAPDVIVLDAPIGSHHLQDAP